MKCTLTFFLPLILFIGLAGCQSKAKPSPVKGPSPYPNSITTAPYEWIPAIDSYGSSFDTGSVFRTDSIVSLSFTLAQKTLEDQWPYIELIANLGGTMAGIDTLILEYTCTAPLIIKLSQADFNTKGNETYSHFQQVLPASPEFSRTTLLISHFEKPDWTPEISKDIPYKPENVDALYFTPDVNYETGGTATLAIRAVYLR